MEAFFCISGVGVLILFSYLLNTARKVAPSTNIAGKRAVLPVYISLADQPRSHH